MLTRLALNSELTLLLCLSASLCIYLSAPSLCLSVPSLSLSLLVYLPTSASAPIPAPAVSAVVVLRQDSSRRATVKFFTYCSLLTPENGVLIPCCSAAGWGSVGISGSCPFKLVQISVRLDSYSHKDLHSLKGSPGFTMILLVTQVSHGLDWFQELMLVITRTLVILPMYGTTDEFIAECVVIKCETWLEEVSYWQNNIQGCILLLDTSCLSPYQTPCSPHSFLSHAPYYTWVSLPQRSAVFGGQWIRPISTPKLEM